MVKNNFLLFIILDDLSLVKNFNEIKTTATIKKLNENVKIQRFAHTDYRKIGIFLDCQCYDVKNVSLLLFEVLSKIKFLLQSPAIVSI